MIEVGEAKSRYEHLTSDRDPALTRAEQAAKVTIPTIFTEDGHHESTDLQTPYQGLGARAVNTLASKIMLALFPPNTAWFRITFDAVTRALFSEQEITEIQSKLGLLEQVIVGELERTRMRPMMYMALRHLLVAGNGVIRVDREGKLKFFPLRQYTCRRDPEGSVIELVIKEEVSPSALPDEVKEACLDPSQLADDPSRQNDVSIFTVMYRDGNRFKVFQEIEGKLVPNSDYSYPVESPPYIVLRWTSIPGEDYGRGLVDEYYGDLAALDDLSRDLLDGAANMAKLVWLLDPNSYLTRRKLVEAKSGDVLNGRREDVSALSAEKSMDFSFVLERIQSIENHIKEAFLMHSSVQRHAERVTAEEIRLMASELESSLGGVYSLLSHELQLPLIRRFIKVLERQNKLPPMPEQDIDILITTGIEALGRGHEVQKLLNFVGSAQNAFGPEAVAQWLNVPAGLQQLATGFGLTNQDLIRSPEQVAAQQQQQLGEDVVRNVAPEVARGAMNQQSNS